MDIEGAVLAADGSPGPAGTGARCAMLPCRPLKGRMLLPAVYILDGLILSPGYDIVLLTGNDDAE
jgi:hypothetical protein